jgi:acetyltransferase-like isoleucine patch superfamily enzyme
MLFTPSLPKNAHSRSFCPIVSGGRLRVVPAARSNNVADRESVFVHPAGICESTQVGEGTRIWAFAHVLPGARIGRDCNICDRVFIENDVVLGDAVTVKSGVQLWDGVRLGNRVLVGPNATFTNDRSRARNSTRRAFWRRPSRTRLRSAPMPPSFPAFASATGQ